ncbi:hypothetical protein TL5118_02987 [Thalassovita autumnalis]|jgi:hypothetical protein|uniref:Uncharacterized protein n=1 Tax=Thalassovita autumnalis TaxID=2072972 RepID=A0A0P1FU90_9RHOB|nr:hypothetical protein TL5118_02987 [Thalassovita autumnalis]CUH72249.1 hypothetical protein TL5120_02045 [Thalassovita autumnalis]
MISWLRAVAHKEQTIDGCQNRLTKGSILEFPRAGKGTAKLLRHFNNGDMLSEASGFSSATVGCPRSRVPLS